MNLQYVKNAYIDFDGTLVDSNGCWKAAYIRLCKRKNIEYSEEIIKLFEKVNFNEWLGCIFKQVDNLSENEFLEFSILEYLNREPKREVVEFINELPTRCKLIVITKEPAELVSRWLNHYNLNIFDGIVTERDNREKVEYYRINNLLVIDDNYKNCIAAKNSGATVVGVNDYHSKEQMKKMIDICDFYII